MELFFMCSEFEDAPFEVDDADSMVRAGSTDRRVKTGTDNCCKRMLHHRA